MSKTKKRKEENRREKQKFGRSQKPLCPLHYSTNKSFGSTVFLNTLHKLLLQQHVNFPTRSRRNDTPHILDLVITDSQLIHNIDTLAPLGKSDQWYL